jgi:hypothetical protein
MWKTASFHGISVALGRRSMRVLNGHTSKGVILPIGSIALTRPCATITKRSNLASYQMLDWLLPRIEHSILPFSSPRTSEHRFKNILSFFEINKIMTRPLLILLWFMEHKNCRPYRVHLSGGGGVWPGVTACGRWGGKLDPVVLNARRDDTRSRPHKIPGGRCWLKDQSISLRGWESLNCAALRPYIVCGNPLSSVFKQTKHAFRGYSFAKDVTIEEYSNSFLGPWPSGPAYFDRGCSRFRKRGHPACLASFTIITAPNNGNPATNSLLHCKEATAVASTSNPLLPPKRLLPLCSFHRECILRWLESNGAPQSCPIS